MTTQASDDEHVRFGIIGTGNWGLFNGRNVLSEDRGVVVAAADPAETARTNAATEFDLPETAIYAGPEELLAAEPLDAVIITSPHTLHYDHITTALDHGLHVFCEKPLVTGTDNAKALVRRVEGTDRVVMPGFQRHLMPAYVTARERWQTHGAVPTSITASITQPWTQHADTWRGDPDLSGGGYLYDTGSHLLDAVLWMTGLTPAGVSAEMTFLDEDRRADLTASLLIDFEEGPTATVTANGDGAVVHESHSIWDGDIGLSVSGRGWSDRSLRIIGPEEDRLPNVDTTPQTKVSAFIDAIQNDSEPPATVRDGLRVTAVTEAAYEAARTGERTPIDLSL